MQVFNDPRCFFLPTGVKTKRRSSRELSGEDPGPLTFTLSAYKRPVQQRPIPAIIGGGLDLGAPVQGVVLGLRLPALTQAIGSRAQGTLSAGHTSEAEEGEGRDTETG